MGKRCKMGYVTTGGNIWIKKADLLAYIKELEKLKNPFGKLKKLKAEIGKCQPISRLLK
jgi:hypothetical protein